MPVIAATRTPAFSPKLARTKGSPAPSAQTITSPSSVGQATAVSAALTASPCELGYGPNVRPPASTTTPAAWWLTVASSVVTRADTWFPSRISTAGGAPVGRSVTPSACGSAPIVGVELGVGSAVSVTTVGGWVAGNGPSLLLPLLAINAVGTITATAAATARPEATRRRRRIEVALPRTSSKASGVADRCSARRCRVRLSSSSRSLIGRPPVVRG